MGGSRDPKASTAAAGIVLCMGVGTTDCHGWVESNRDAAREQGYLVFQGHDPATVPLMHQLYGLVTLTERGTAIKHDKRVGW